jgi:phosphoribosylanthranilate isomerase
MRLRLKICCIASREEAAIAVAVGADAIGLVGAMPSGPGPIADETIAEIVPSVPPPVMPFLLTSETRAADIHAHATRTGVATVQIVSHVAPETLADLKAYAPELRLVQVVHVDGAETIELAEAYAQRADALLLDSGRPNAAVAELGGTGRRHDWNISAQIVARVRIPVFLAGGLNPGNVREAAAAVQPFGVDVCSGLREDGALVPERAAAFARALWQ